jgi:hypothetical protein
MKKLLQLLFIALLLSFKSIAATYYSRASGDFALAATWSSVSCAGAASATIPGVADSVVICNGFTVSVVSSLTVKSVTVLAGGTLDNGPTAGNLSRTLTVTGTLNVQNGATLILRSKSQASTTLFAGTELFGSSSTLRVIEWSDANEPLITGVSSNLGRVILAWNPGTFYWNNNGLGSTRIIQSDFILQNGCATLLNNVAGNISVPIGGKLIVEASTLRFKSGVAGDVSVTTGDSVVIRGTGPLCYGIYQENGKFSLNAPVFNISSGTFYGIYNGDGDANFTIGAYLHSAGDFRGIQNTATFTAGIANFQLGSFSFSGGTYLANYGCHVGGRTVQFNVTGNMNINYTAATDIVSIVRLATLSTTACTHALNLTVGGNLSIGGVALGEFNGNNGSGVETVSVTGNIQIANGNNYFNVVPAFGSNGHATTISVGGQLTINGGNTYFSSEAGNLLVNVTGITSITAGTLSAKGQAGVGTINLNSSYNQSGGTYLFYNNATVLSASPVTTTVLGDFAQSGGTINFSNLATATGLNTLVCKGANYTISGAGQMIRAGAGTATTFGTLQFYRNGTISFTRSGTHNVQQVKQVVMPACTVDVISGNVQVASHATAAVDYFTVSGNAVLDLRASQLFSNVLAVNSGVQVLDNGRLRTAHPQGWYNNTTTAALNNAGAMNYSLGATSVVEYYASVNQVMTGINTGLATAAQHKYGIVEVNQNAAGIWVTPTNLPGPSGNVFARTELRLTQGVLNLANATTTVTSGGRDITIENPAAAGITRVNGMIISETADFSGAINWLINTDNSVHVVPFAYTTLQLIPVTYTLTGGGAGTMRFSTYHTPATNLPWPLPVTNLNSLIGLSPDNRDATVDRFWLVQTSAAPIATLTLNYIASEIPIAPYNVPTSMRAQHYDLGVNKWQPSLPGQAAGSYVVSVPAISTQRIWTLSNAASPLPVEWLNFDVKPMGNTVLVSWSTASETGNDHFIVERSKDLQSPTEDIGLVQGAGNAVQVNQYTFSDVKPYPGLSYYRIRQVDFDGEETVTAWKAVEFKTKSLVRYFPNPTTGVFYIVIEDGTVGECVLLDISGRVVFTQQLEKGMTFAECNLSVLPKGVYTIVFNAQNGETSREQVVLH